MQAMIEVFLVYPQFKLKVLVDDKDSCLVEESRSLAVNNTCVIPMLKLSLPAEGQQETIKLIALDEVWCRIVSGYILRRRNRLCRPCEILQKGFQK